MSTQKSNQNERDALSEEEKNALDIELDTEEEEEGCKNKSTVASNEELRNHPIIIRFQHETGKSLEWLLEKVTVDPTGDEDDPDGLCAPSWPVSWPADELSADHIHILQGAAIFVWVHKNKVKDLQKDSVYDYLELLEKESKVKNTNRKNAERKSRKDWAGSLANDLVSRNPQATFMQLWNMIPEDSEYHAGFEVYVDGDRLCADGGDKGRASISKDHFRIEYIGKARKAIKKSYHNPT